MSSSRSGQTKPDIIPCSVPLWQAELRKAIADPGTLLQILGLDAALSPGALAAADQFPMRVTRHFASLMEYGNPDDPLLRQVLPRDLELQPKDGFSNDPVGDNEANTGAGVLRKYQGRALLVTTGACAINCRYCFRRHYPYDEESLQRSQLQAMLQRLKQDQHTNEVILSGGDPLSLSDRRIEELIGAIEDLKQVVRLRIHTRLPVVLPDRITPDLLRLLGNTRLQSVVVIHANHPNEIDPRLRSALLELRAAGVTVLNQAVLLQGVNNNAQVLSNLSERLFDAGVLPYYLHALDRVNGSAHFEVSRQRGRELIAEMRDRLPGFLVPNFVVEQAGAASKLPA